MPWKESIPMTTRYYKRIRPVKGTFDLGLSEIATYKDLLYFFAWKEFKIKYRQTGMGATWAVFQPIIAAIVFWFIFGRLLALQSDDIPFFIFAYCGLTLWLYFSVALATSTTSLVTNANMLTKVYFPRILLPMASCIVGLIDFTIASVIMFIMLPFYGIAPTIWMLMFPIPIILMLLLAMGLGFWLSTICVKYRDVQYAVPFFIQILLFVSPITYTISNIPPEVKQYVILNPLTGIMVTQRAIILGATPIDWDALIISAVFSVLVFFSGWIYFKSYEREFADVI